MVKEPVARQHHTCESCARRNQNKQRNKYGHDQHDCAKISEYDRDHGIAIDNKAYRRYQGHDIRKLGIEYQHLKPAAATYVKNDELKDDYDHVCYKCIVHSLITPTHPEVRLLVPVRL